MEQLLGENINDGATAAAAQVAKEVEKVVALTSTVVCASDPQLCDEIAALEDKVAKLALALVALAASSNTAQPGMVGALTSLKVVANALAALRNAAGCSI